MAKLEDVTSFVPPDDGDDATRTVEVPLAELRSLVMYASELEQRNGTLARQLDSARATLAELNYGLTDRGKP